MDNLDKLYELSHRAYCFAKCRNWSKAYDCCMCGMDATKCVLNPLVQKLKARQESKTLEKSED